MTQGGAAFELPTLAPRIEESASSSLPTPQAVDWKGGMGAQWMFSDAVREILLLPPPAAQEPGGTVDAYRRRLLEHDGRTSGFTPLGMISALLPTPSGRDHKGRNQRDDETCLPGALRGVSMSPRFDGGKPSEATVLHGQLTIGDD